MAVEALNPAASRPERAGSDSLRVAAAQARPVWLDPAAGAVKAATLIADAAAQGAQVIVFPEAFLGGYPFWLGRTNGAAFGDEAQKSAYAAYMDAAISLDGPELAVLRDACAEHDIWAFVGVCERGTRAGRGSVYCTVAVLDSRGKLAGAHRKLVPTHDERLVWAFGDGAGLCCYDIAGARVGALLCWENWMPQARLALYADGADVHLSLWPGSAALTHQITRFIALEGRVWSIAAGGVLSLADVPPGFPLAEQLLAYGEELPFDGGSCVADPSGRWVHEPLVCKEELLIIDCARETVRRERLLFDPAGHYSRPDVFTTSIDRRRRLPVEFEDDR